VDIAENPPMESSCDISFLKNRRIRVITCVSRIYYELDFGLRILDIRPSTLFLTKYAEYSGSGKIKTPLTPEYWKSLARQALYWNGKEWVSEPAMSSPW